MRATVRIYCDGINTRWDESVRSPAATPVLIGHPFAPIGRGEDIRCTFRALRAVAIRPKLLDLYPLQIDAGADCDEFTGALTLQAGGLNIFHLNGDEVETALKALGGRLPDNAYNIIYPAWELSRYPQEWLCQLDRFDEIWAPSEFIRDSLRDGLTRPLLHMPLACEVVLSSLLNRRYFGIAESAYAFLFFFDLRSYTTRKNPMAVLQAYLELRVLRPTADCCLIIKLNGSEHDPVAAAELRNVVAAQGERVVLIDQTLSDDEIKNLIRCCDCFVSLHRAEGFGRGLAEAMYLGKPVIATAYSGNLDFMHAHNSLLVDYQLIPLREGDYPAWQDQFWADPDIEQAARLMVQLLDDPSWGQSLGRLASLDVRRSISYRACGLRYRNRLAEIVLTASD